MDDKNNVAAETQEVRKVGRPTDYTQELGDKICELLANGQGLVSICQAPEMPRRSTVHNWLNSNHPTFQPEFLDKYARARDDQADYKAEEIETIADDLLKGKYKPDQARVAIDAKKWTASKLKPKKYGERVDLTTGGEKLATPIYGGLSVTTIRKAGIAGRELHVPGHDGNPENISTPQAN